MSRRKKDLCTAPICDHYPPRATPKGALSQVRLFCCYCLLGGLLSSDLHNDDLGDVARVVRQRRKLGIEPLQGAPREVVELALYVVAPIPSAREWPPRGTY